MKLFLGTPFTAKLRQELNPTLLPLFEGYLTEIKHGEDSYLGKESGQMPTVDQLDNLDSHIRSLLKRLAPNYDPEPCQLITSSL